MFLKSPLVLLVLFFLLSPAGGRAGESRIEKNITYLGPGESASADAYRKKKCVLDLYVPAEAKNCPVIVWFHGGGLTEGDKSLPAELMNHGYCIVVPNYRLTPKAKAVNAIEDAAAATAWVFKNIGRYGGNPDLVFMTGHSAGGYLSAMVTLDRRWLKPYGIDPDRIAALVPFSGQMITHFAIRAERGMPSTQPVIDGYAPLFYVRADAPPMLMITGDRELELLGRYEECAYMNRMMKLAGSRQTRLVEIPGTNHMGMIKPAFPLLVAEVERIRALRTVAKP